jgi:hypothetical protein
VVERVKMFHRWLNERHGACESLTGIPLDGFTDQVMATLVEADSRGSVKRGRDGATSKGTGMLLPTFNGSQSQYKVWNRRSTVNAVTLARRWGTSVSTTSNTLRSDQGGEVLPGRGILPEISNSPSSASVPTPSHQVVFGYAF